MTDRPEHPPAESYSLHMAPSISRPTSPPPPRKKPDQTTLTVSQALATQAYTIQRLTEELAAANERNRYEQQQRLLLAGQIKSLTERLGKYECPDCGDSEQIVDCHHDGETCGVPECDYRHCNGCGHQWGYN